LTVPQTQRRVTITPLRIKDQLQDEVREGGLKEGLELRVGSERGERSVIEMGR
jgi:hypothetical protein